jgi:exosortase
MALAGAAGWWAVEFTHTEGKRMATTECSPEIAAIRPPRAGAAVPRLALLGGAALLLAFLPLLALHFRQLWLRPHLQFVPFVVLGAGVLAFVRLRAPGLVLAAPGRVTYALAAAAWALLACAELLYSPWLGAVAALTALAAAVLGVGGRPLMGRLWPALALLALAVPPPFELDRELVLALQRLTTAWSSRVLDYLGVLHLRAGNVIEVGGRRLLVEEACSGVNSLLPVVACTLFFVFLVRRPPVRAVLLVAAAVAWALAANMVRVVLVTCLSTSGGPDLTGGWRHEAVGLALFAVVLALVASTDKLLQFLAAPPSPSAAPAGPALPAPEGPPARRPWFASWPVALAFLLPAAFHLWAYGGLVPREWPTADGALASLGDDALPARCEAWERQGFTTEARKPGSAYGEFSRIWTYGHGGGAAAVSLDYPFPDWHDLTRCYTNQGWVIDEETVHESAGAEDLPGGYVEVRMSQSGYRSGYLLYCQFDGAGRPLPPRRGGVHLAAGRHEATLHRLWEVARGTPEAPPAEPEGPVYQFQLFCEGLAPPTPAQQQQAGALFTQCWMALRQQLPRSAP